MLGFEVDSVRGFVRLWVALTVVVLLYAWLDLRTHPPLMRETHFSLKPDLSQIYDLRHWGGRLLKHGALGLLVGNALVIAGLAALVGRGLLLVIRRLRAPSADARVSIVPGSVPTSVPPPRTR